MEKVTRAMPRVLNSSQPADRKRLCCVILSFFVIGLVSGTVRAQAASSINMSGVPNTFPEMGTGPRHRECLQG